MSPTSAQDGRFTIWRVAHSLSLQGATAVKIYVPSRLTPMAGLGALTSCQVHCFSDVPNLLLPFSVFSLHILGNADNGIHADVRFKQ